MNRPIRNIAIACLVMFTALLLNVNYVQFVDAESLNAKNGNKRVTNEQFSRNRGAILVDGKAVADATEGRCKVLFSAPERIADDSSIAFAGSLDVVSFIDRDFYR